MFNERHPGSRITKEKETTISKWVGVPLSNDQLNYAALDAFVSFKLGYLCRSDLDGCQKIVMDDLNKNHLNLLSAFNAKLHDVEGI